MKYILILIIVITSSCHNDACKNQFNILKNNIDYPFIDKIEIMSDTVCTFKIKLNYSDYNKSWRQLLISNIEENIGKHIDIPIVAELKLIVVFEIENISEDVYTIYISKHRLSYRNKDFIFRDYIFNNFTPKDINVIDSVAIQISEDLKGNYTFSDTPFLDILNYVSTIEKNTRIEDIYLDILDAELSRMGKDNLSNFTDSLRHYYRK